MMSFIGQRTFPKEKPEACQAYLNAPNSAARALEGELGCVYSQLHWS